VAGVAEEKAVAAAVAGTVPSSSLAGAAGWWGGCILQGFRRDSQRAGRLGHGGLEIAVGAVRVCAAPGPLMVRPLELILRAALSTPGCSP